MVEAKALCELSFFTVLGFPMGYFTALTLHKLAASRISSVITS